MAVCPDHRGSGGVCLVVHLLPGASRHPGEHRDHRRAGVSIRGRGCELDISGRRARVGTDRGIAYFDLGGDPAVLAER